MTRTFNMKKEKTINGSYFLETDTCFVSSRFKKHTFIKVDEWPSGYSVWPIGRENFQFEGWLPLCKDGKNEYEWQRNIDTNSLKAIKVKSEDVALRCLDAAIKGECRTREDYIRLIDSL